MSYSEYISQLTSCTPFELRAQEKSSLLRLIELSIRKKGIHSYFRFKRQPPISDEDERVLSTLARCNLIKVIHGNKLRRGGRSYVLTSCGLFYILTENKVFSGILLLKYNENMILQFLLFQYLEENTVRNWSPRVRIIISEYLHKCCVISKRTIETIRNSKNSEDEDRHLKLLELELKALAYCLGIRLTRLYSRHLDTAKLKDLENNAHPRQEENRMLSLLSSDNKFLQFRSSVLKEFIEAFDELTRLEPD